MLIRYVVAAAAIVAWISHCVWLWSVRRCSRLHVIFISGEMCGFTFVGIAKALRLSNKYIQQMAKDCINETPCISFNVALNIDFPLSKVSLFCRVSISIVLGFFPQIFSYCFLSTVWSNLAFHAYYFVWSFFLSYRQTHPFCGFICVLVTHKEHNTNIYLSGCVVPWDFCLRSRFFYCCSNHKPELCASVFVCKDAAEYTWQNEEKNWLHSNGDDDDDADDYTK